MPGIGSSALTTVSSSGAITVSTFVFGACAESVAGVFPGVLFAFSRSSLVPPLPKEEKDPNCRSVGSYVCIVGPAVRDMSSELVPGISVTIDFCKLAKFC